MMDGENNLQFNLLRWETTWKRCHLLDCQT